jgi:serine/threonine protein kinase/Tol biopolymer transport system component
MMSEAARWSRVKALFQAALDREPHERAAFLREACGTDAALHDDVESLVRAHQDAGSFAQGPAVQALGQSAADAVQDALGLAGRVLVAGDRVGPYEILSVLGAGGMGEVYRARDATLRRDVAIKILPPAFAADPERLARFDREARVLASLSHPHVASIYGLEDAAGGRALVLELVEGETLEERIARGAVPATEALAIARQIADALDAAHEKGIIHRDLKPANITVTPDGTVKVLDFGVAKLQGSDGSRLDVTQSPTLTVEGTREGMVLGTAAYMSPEQARGQAVDKRTDIWAFGCVLFEMLTGRSAFAGATVPDTMAAILEREPDWRMLPTATPGTIQRLLQRCLVKDPKRRLHDIADARIELEDTLTAPAPTVLRPRGRSRTPWIIAALAVAVGVFALTAMVYMRRAAPELVVTRLDVVTPSTSDPFSFALSADGRQLAFVANGEKGPQLWVRPLDQVTARPLNGTEGAGFPFWAPDGRAIGFFADSQLKRIDLAGGMPRVLADAPNARGGTWNRDDVIVFAPNTAMALLRVTASPGGTPTPVTRLAADEGSHRFPQFLPDGRRVLFFMTLGQPHTHGVYVVSLDGGEPTRVLAAESAAAYAPPGYLVRVAQGMLVAQRFDAVRATLIGEPIPVAESVGVEEMTSHGAFSVSSGSVLVYRAGASARRQLVWADRTGKVVGGIGTADEAGPNSPEVSPNGQRVAVHRTVQGNADVWLTDLARGATSRFTTDPAFDGNPVWSPDGSQIVFESLRRGGLDLFQKAANGAGEEQPFLVNAQEKTPFDWSPEGFLLYTVRDSVTKTGSTLWAAPVTGDRQPFPVLQSSFETTQGQFSPDGHWLAYTSSESGHGYEVYIRPFRETGGSQTQVSTAGGSQPRWRRDGTELFYLASDGQLMAVPIRVVSERRALDVGTPVALFQTRLIVGAISVRAGFDARMDYAVARDGRFLLDMSVDDTSPITVVQNWTAGLKK